MTKRFYILALIIAVLGFSGIGDAAYAKRKARGKKQRTERIDGIDISHHNGLINWGKVTREHPDIKFVYIKATEGATWTDSNYEYNLKHARKKGILAGAYHFFNYRCDAKTQFNNFKRNVGASQQDIIPMVDFEKYGSEKNATKAVKQLKSFCKMVKKHYGVYPMIYTNERIYNDLLWKDFGNYHLFIAKYKQQEPSLKGNARYTIWQYSERGKLKGVSENVDLNRFHPDFSVYSITYSSKKKRK